MRSFRVLDGEKGSSVAKLGGIGDEEIMMKRSELSSISTLKRDARYVLKRAEAR